MAITMVKKRRLKELEIEARRVKGTPGIGVDPLEKAWAGDYLPGNLKALIQTYRHYGADAVADELQAAFDQLHAVSTELIT